MARKDTNTIQTYTAVKLDSDGNVVIGTDKRPVDATKGASFDCGTIEYTAALALVLASIRARLPKKAHKFVGEMTRLRLSYRDHFQVVRTWKGNVRAAGMFLSQRGAAREGTWAAGLLSVLANKVGAVNATEAIREHSDSYGAAYWAELFDGMGRTAIPGIVGPTYTQIHVKGAGKDSGFKPSVKQGYESGDLNPDSVGYFICG